MLFNTNDALIDNSFIFIIKNNLLIILAGMFVSTPICGWIKNKLSFNNKIAINVCNIISVALYFIGFMLSVSYLVSSSYNPFLYFRF